MTEYYALIIEGSWCGRTHVQGFYSTLLEAIFAVRDFIEDNFENEEQQAKLLLEFADNDFLFIDGILTIDEVVIK